MSPLNPELNFSITPEKSSFSNKEIQEIISLWKERLPSLSELTKKLAEDSLEKTEKVLQYTNEATKNNAINNAFNFLALLGLYLSSPSYQPPQTIEELIDGLNSFCPNPPFLKPGDSFTTVDPLGNKHSYKIKSITLSNEFPPDFMNGGHCSGANMWDSPGGNCFIPGNYWTE